MRRLLTLLSALVLALLSVPAAHAQVPNLALLQVEKEVLVSAGLAMVSAVDVAPDGRVVVAERSGRVHVWHQDGTMVLAGRLPIDAMGCPDCPAKDQNHGGISGMALSPDFADDQWVYMYFSRAGEGDEKTNLRPWVLSRFKLTDDDQLLLDSEEILLENQLYWKGVEADGNHRSGDIAFLPDGTLLLSTGDDTMPRDSSGFAPRDFREGRDAWNAERTSQNPASRLGSLLRLNPDGSVPDGKTPGVAANPHIDDPAYDPYVYAKGFRQPWRFAVDPKSGTAIVGVVGPDAFLDDPQRGPSGKEEVEEVPLGGGTNHGWPRCIGANLPYHDYDFQTGASNGPLSCEGFVPAAMVTERSLPSLDAPTMSTHALTAIIIGEVYRYDGDGALALPAGLRNHVLGGDWQRNALFALPLDDAGKVQPPAWRLPVDVLGPIDMAVGADGAVYIAEYGSQTFGASSNNNGRLSRLKCVLCQPDPAADFGIDVPATTSAVSEQLSATTAAATAPPVLPFTGLLALPPLVLGVLRRRKLV
jgi:aldose sugar dehydrogenase